MGGWGLNSFACNCKDHPVTHGDENKSLRSSLAATHFPELAVDPLTWFATFEMEKYWRSSDEDHTELQGLIQFWSSDGTYDQLNLGGVAALNELARQIQSFVDAYSDPDHVNWSDSRSDNWISATCGHPGGVPSLAH